MPTPLPLLALFALPAHAGREIVYLGPARLENAEIAATLHMPADTPVVAVADHGILGQVQAWSAGRDLLTRTCDGPPLDQKAWLASLDAARDLALNESEWPQARSAFAAVQRSQMCLTERVDDRMVRLPFLYEGRLRFLEGDREGARGAFMDALVRSTTGNLQWPEQWVQENTSYGGSPAATAPFQAAADAVDQLGHVSVWAGIPPGSTLLVDGQIRTSSGGHSYRPGTHLVQVAGAGASTQSWLVTLSREASVVVWIPRAGEADTDLYALNDALRRLFRALPPDHVPAGIVADVRGERGAWTWNGVDLMAPSPLPRHADRTVGWSLLAGGAGLAAGSGALALHSVNTPIGSTDEAWLHGAWAGMGAGGTVAAAGGVLLARHVLEARKARR